ncbi:tRNA-dihydrouridine synthase C [Truncatella angustata]|uniref:tRNA-dihydrouridine(16/17) synthase [NAD(P)(+)] n=1 Tax=Truncatella angustata TaxID=152316 RepID=A0A9P8UKT9_9PEZI|nr:tRNA-dihydrouridine synthase C [Truncatella angustata]KAH6654102.1 tRNA-dihydrouridine synthase C [Truncatella angustata]
MASPHSTTATAPVAAEAVAATAATTTVKPKLHGRAFYESIGSPKFVVAPMVDQSEFAWRMLTRSFMTPAENSKLLAYTPMFHARLFEEVDKYRQTHFQAIRPLPPAKKGESDPEPESKPSADTTPWLDGNPSIDRPLFVQFCANEPDHLLAAAQHAAPYCDAVDLNLGCPQGIARKGHYGAFLQEDQDLIYRLVNTLHLNLSIPVTAKIRILENKEQTLAYAKNVLSAGASIITVHGRRREQKGHLTGVADWSYIRYLRENLPAETVIFANGNILQPGDVEKCLEATGADAVMSAEGNLSDPSIFAALPDPGTETREYWRGKDDKGGYRVDAVFRRYMDITYQYVLQTAPPARRPLFVVGDDESWLQPARAEEEQEEEGPQKKKRKIKADGPKQKPKQCCDPNLLAMRPHLFHLLRHFVAKNVDIRDALAKARPGDVPAFEHVLQLVEKRVAEGLIEYEKTGGKSLEEHKLEIKSAPVEAQTNGNADGAELGYDPESSVATVKACKRAWWVAQPIVRPLPAEAMAKGALSLSKKDKKKMEQEQAELEKTKSQGGGIAQELPIPDGTNGIKEPVMDENQKGLVDDALVCG